MSLHRAAIAAGRFYPAETAACRRMIESLVEDIDVPSARGAIVPHAGWIFSGKTAARGLSAIASARPQVVVVFGAAHRASRHAACVYPSGSWITPLGSIEVHDGLAGRFSRYRLLVEDVQSHAQEHSIEVQLPIVKHLLPEAAIVPILVQPSRDAAEVGRICASEVLESGMDVGFVASTDLTHYGPAYGYEPAGSGPDGVRWAKEENDRRFLSLVGQLAADGVVAEADEHKNACGAGAVAALLGGMVEMGCVTYTELEHTCSSESGPPEYRDPRNSVGYASGIFQPAA